MSFLKAALVAIAFAVGSATAQDGDIVETARGAGTVNTLLAAARTAGLADTLVSGENLTVFAPKDEVTDGAVEISLKEENKDKLVAVLSYHVLTRELASNQLPGGAVHIRTIKSGGDRTLVLAKSSFGIAADDANVVAAEIKADNGVIHVIDQVMLPSK